MKETLVGYNRHTIYKIHIKKQNKVIQVKDLCIFEDYKIKKSTKLQDYSNNLPVFQDFYYENNDQELEKTISCTNQKVSAREENLNTRSEEGQETLQLPLPISTCVNNTKTKLISQNLCAGKKPKVTIKAPQKCRTGCMIKLFTKALEAIRQAKTHIFDLNFLCIPQKNVDVEKLIVLLITTLSN